MNKKVCLEELNEAVRMMKKYADRVERVANALKNEIITEEFYNSIEEQTKTKSLVQGVTK